MLPPPPDNPAPGLSDNFAIATRDSDGVTVLGVSGSIDLSTARDLHAELQRHVDEPVIVDLCACDFVDSTSIGVLLRRYRSAPALTRIVAAPVSTSRTVAAVPAQAATRTQATTKARKAANAYANSHYGSVTPARTAGHPGPRAARVPPPAAGRARSASAAASATAPSG